MTTPAPALSTKDVADKVFTDAKTLRVFLRASDDYEVVGSGSRYSFTAKDVPTLKARFNEWRAEREATKKTNNEEKAKLTVVELTTPVRKPHAFRRVACWWAIYVASGQKPR